MSEKEFKINDILTLKLENGVTNIYVKGKLFRQCKFLLMNKLYPDEIKDFIEDFKSVDEKIEQLDQSLEYEEQIEKVPPEAEFWAHCSNLQVWVENDYDTRLLHRNLAFPLLKRLSNNGGSITKIKFKEEIIKRLESGVPTVINYLLEGDYIQYLSKEEFLYAILEPEDAEVLLELEQLIQYNYGWIENFEVLRGIDDRKSELHFATKDKRITELELFFDKTKSILHLNSINKLINLKTLYIHINEFVDSLSKPEVGIDSLEELRIFSYGETTLPNFFDKFPNLKRLYIYGGFFETTPESIGTLKTLKLLLINRTSLRSLPESIDNLKSLEILNLRHCNLWALPKTITRLKKIKRIEINYALLDEKIEKWLNSINLVQVSEIRIGKYKNLVFKKIGKKNN